MRASTEGVGTVVDDLRPKDELSSSPPRRMKAGGYKSKKIMLKGKKGRQGRQRAGKLSAAWRCWEGPTD